MRNLKLIRATVDDAEELKQLMYKAFLPLYQKYNDTNNPCNISHDKLIWKIENSYYYKITCNDIVVGGISILERDGNHNHLDALYIHPDYKNNGIAYWAIREAERLHSAIIWTLDTPSDAFGNRHLYEKCGYKLTGETEFINEDLSLVYYRKEETKMIINVRPNLLLRTLITEDSEENINLVNINRDYLRVWLPWIDDTTKVEDTKRVIENWQKSFEKGTDIVFGIFSDKQFIGIIGIHYIDKSNKKAEIGYWLSKENNGNGIMTDSVKAVINYCFDELELNRISIYCGTENKKSRAIPERLGFTFEGIAQDAENLYGTFIDHAMYGIIKKNWDCPNLYRKTADLYDYDQRDNMTDDIPFYLEYAQKQSGEILELACGTGRVSIELANNGYDVTGLDLSNNMLNVFRKKIAQQNELKDKITLSHANMASFRLNKKYALIITPFRAFQSLTNDTDVAACLKCINEHLDDNGIFIINVFEPHGILDQSWCYEEKVQWERIDEATGNKIVKKHWGDRIDTDKQIIYPKFAYEVTKPNGTSERATESLALKYYYYQQLKSLLEANHFAISEEYGWYDKSEINTGREFIFVCRNKC